MTAAADRRFMRRALGLARRALGTTAPNPAVGCVLVGPDGAIVGEAATAPGGRPHAETAALLAAGPRAAGATAYVTLEPCAHHGRTPPCAGALAQAGVARVVVAMATDPDPRVDGRGLAMLRAAGVLVETGLLGAEAAEIVAGFVHRVRTGRPLVTLKLACSADGRTATRTKESQWITGPLARRAVHRLRAAQDGVLIGLGTLLADDPLLTCRLPGYGDRPRRRIVLDPDARTPPTARLLADAERWPVIILVGPDAADARCTALASRPGVTLLPTPLDPAGRTDLQAALAALGALGLNGVLVEAGARLAAAFVRARLADRLVLHRAPMLIGGDGLPLLESLGVDRLQQAPRLTLLARRTAGPDLLETYAIDRPG